MVVVLFGVTGAGKSVVGRLLAKDLGWTFYDADEFHTAASVAKMRQGEALTDADRAPWLERLREEISRLLERREHAVLACSALKKAYRRTLAVSDAVKFVHLRGDYPVIESRLRDRREHFMNPSLLQSQFDALEEPEEGKALVLDVSRTPRELVHAIRSDLAI